MLLGDISIIPHGIGPEKMIVKFEIENTVDHPNRPEFGNYLVTMTINNTKRKFNVKGHKRDDGISVLMEKVFHEWNGITDRARKTKKLDVIP